MTEQAPLRRTAPSTAGRRPMVALAVAIALGLTASCQASSPDPRRGSPVHGLGSPHSQVASDVAAPARVNIWAVTATDLDHILAVGGTQDDRGDLVVARSEDGGDHWRVVAPSAPALTTLGRAGSRLVGATSCVPRSVDGRAVDPTPSSCLFASDDEGASWRDLGAGRLVGPSFADDRNGWASGPIDPGLGTSPSLFTTADGGVTWRDVGSPCGSDTPLIWKAMITAPGSGYVVCLGLPGPTGQEWRFLEVDQRGSILRHHGHTPASGPIGGLDDDSIYGFAMQRDGHGLLWASTGLYRTADRGVSWELVPTGDLEGTFWGGGALISDTAAYLVARNGGAWTAIYGTRDGRTWQPFISWPFFGGGSTPGP